jgi:pilus assembly protein CpaC
MMTDASPRRHFLSAGVTSMTFRTGIQKTARTALLLALHASVTGLVLAAPLAIGAGEAAARDTGKLRPVSGDGLYQRKVDLALGKSVMIDLPRDAKEVFVASPEVANAVVRTARKIYVIGLKAGSTSVLINDGDGNQIMSLDVAVAKELTSELNSLRDILKQAIPSAQITVKGVGNNIILSGMVDSPLDAQRAVDLATKLAGQASFSFFGGSQGAGGVINALTIRGKDQVMLKVVVSEVNRTVIKQLGVNFDGSWKVGGKQLQAIIDNPYVLQKQTLSTTGIYGTPNTPTVRTLERNGLLRTLAEPTLTAISGEAAKFLAGGEIPIPTSQQCDTGTLGRRVCQVYFSYKPIGVSLTFTPLVLSENRISVRVSTEVTELDSDNQITGADVNFPAFRTRKAETTVELPSGGVMAMAGMIMQQSKHGVIGVPALMNLPILGTLFRSRDYQRNESELMITVQPVIAKASEPGQIARPDDGFADASDPSQIFMNRMVRTYGQGVARPDPFGGKVGFIND